jgi:hypothetical protein
MGLIDTTILSFNEQDLLRSSSSTAGTVIRRINPYTLEVWGQHLSQHFLITITASQEYPLDILFIVNEDSSLYD